MDKYRKFVIALLAAIVEGGALWVDAPPWFVSLVGFAGAALVFWVKNAPVDSPQVGVR
jgi:hypothetical protein